MDKKIVQAIDKIINPIIKLIITPFKTKFMKYTGLVKKLPATFSKKIMAFIKGILNPKSLTIKDYVPLGRYYVAKKLIVMICLLVFFIVYILFIKPPAFVNSLFHRTTILHEKPMKEITYTGNAKLYDKNDRFKYEGEFLDGLYAGQGKLYNEQGKLIYEGGFEKGLMNGNGSLYNDQAELLYKGAFASGIYSGTGTLFYSDKKVKYQGEFQNGAIGGAGILYYPNGLKQYEGSFNAGAYNGMGKLYNEAGVMIYEGNFIANEYSGEGKLHDSAGELLYEGSFKNGEYSGEGTLYYPNGFIQYQGQFLVGKYSGTGSTFNDEGIPLYTGAFIDGKYNGPGELYNLAGLVEYKGNFKNGLKEGMGTLYDKDGTVTYLGFFNKNQIFYEEFIGLSSAKVEEILGKPDEVALPEDLNATNTTDNSTEIPASGDTGSPSVEVENNSEDDQAPLPATSLFMLFNKYQMALEVQLSPVNNKETTVESIKLWGKTRLNEMLENLNAFIAENYLDKNGLPISKSQITLDKNSYAIIYIKDNYQFSFYYDKNTKSVQQLIIELVIK